MDAAVSRRAAEAPESITISFVGRDEDGDLLAVATVEEATVGSIMLELLRRGDDTHAWWELLCGPGGWVNPGNREPFRVLRVVNPTGKLLHDYEAGDR
jgi:hypothetical protein